MGLDAVDAASRLRPDVVLMGTACASWTGWRRTRGWPGLHGELVRA